MSRAYFMASVLLPLIVIVGEDSRISRVKKCKLYKYYLNGVYQIR